jgi:hypothetical protein
MRQVNGWGFKRIVSGNDHNSYYHEYFVRENPQMCLKMKRIKKKSTSSKAKRGEGDSEDDDTKAASDDEGSLDKSGQQQPPPPPQSSSNTASSVSVPSAPPQQLPFQQMDMMNAQSPALFAAALQNMQGGAGGASGASAFQSPAFPGLNPSMPLNGLPNAADTQWMLAAGMLGGGTMPGNAGGLISVAAQRSLNGVGQQNSNGGSGGEQNDASQQQQIGQPGTNGLPASLGDMSGVDSALYAKIQAALQHQQQQQQFQQVSGQAAAADSTTISAPGMEQHDNGNAAASSKNALEGSHAQKTDEDGRDENDNEEEEDEDDHEDDDDDDESGEFGSDDGSSGTEV